MGASVYIFELVIPGTWLDYEDQGWSGKVGGLLDNLQSQFFEANLALNLFSNSHQAQDFPFPDREKWEQDAQLRRQIQLTVEQERSRIDAIGDWEEIRHETEIRFKRAQWEKGAIPREFQQKTPLLYARCFLYALDGFDKFLRVLAEIENAPSELAMSRQRMASLFPSLRGVRDSAQHLEDRARALGRDRKPLALKPVDNEMVKAPGGVLILNSLNGSKYGSTMSDGHYGEVDVSPESMTALLGLLTDVLNAFNWTGPRQHKPNV